MVETALDPAAPAPVVRPAAGFRKWLAIGTGVGIEVAGPDLRVVVARVRPSGVEITDATVIRGFRERPAAEWGAEYVKFARRQGIEKTPVMLVLPREEVVVRVVNLPGVDEADLASAVGYQVDSLHPWGDEPVAHCWARIRGTGAVMVGMTRQPVVEDYANLLSEAGLKTAGFTFSAAALHCALRVSVEPAAEVLAAHEGWSGVEVYGESAARPVYTGWFDEWNESIAGRVAGELRIESPTDTPGYAELLGHVKGAPEDYEPEAAAVALAAAICAACPRLAPAANLLPEDRRTALSRWKYAPTLVLASLVAVAAAIAASQPAWQERQYRSKLDAEIRVMEKQVARAAELDRAAAGALEKIALLDRYRQRSAADADALREATNILAPPAWIHTFQINRTDLYLGGEAEQAAALLKIVDGSSLFRDSSFTQSMARVGGSTLEQFVIRARREGPGTGVEAEAK